jgi:superfamily II DNA or RNA helicase
MSMKILLPVFPTDCPLPTANLHLFAIQPAMYNYGPMSQLEKLGRQVHRKIQLRGKEYFERNAVKIIFADEEFVSAQVSGSREYTVDLEREREDLVFSCDCPYFEDHFEVCKHVWAVLLEMEKKGFLLSWGANGPSNLVSTGSDDYFFDQDPDDFDNEEEDERITAPPTGIKHSPSEKHLTSPPTRGWQQLLSKINWPRELEERSPFWPSGREILYILERSRNLSDRNLVIQIDVRDRKKNGEWRKSKPLSLSHDSFPDLTNFADREILTRLIGVKRDTWYYGSYESVFRFQLKSRDLITLLPLISKTERFYFRSSEIDEPRPVRWDEQNAWEFCIDVRIDEPGSQYEICGAFYRSGERLNLSQPEYIFHEGILVCDALIAPFTGSFEWISFFRHEGSFFVPLAEADQWLETTLGMPSTPPLHLPEALRLEEMTGVPKPIVRVSTKKETWGTSYLIGEMYFDYLGRVIEERDPATGIPLVAERKRIVRNLLEETQARQKFEDAGFKLRHDYRGTDIWTITQSRLPAAVRDLVIAGWHVEADGKLFRNPDSFNLRISSGIDWFELHGAVEFGGSQVHIPRLLSALKRHENTILLDDGSFGMIPEDWMKKYGILAGLGTTEGDHIRFKRHQAGLLDALLASRPEVSCDDLFDHMRKELHSFDGIVSCDAPAGFCGSLRSYQREGLGWIHFLERFNLGGCLADDMGLGKTIQVLALLEERRVLRSRPDMEDLPPSLVVVPRSLVFNWCREAERFTPNLRILEHAGGERIRSYEHFKDYDVIVTTYGTLRRDASFFKEKMFDYIILDEAQAIKNPSTESAKAARLLWGKNRLALSGTPIENHLGELWSLFEFLNPGMLGSASVLKLGKGSFVKIEDDTRVLLAHALRPFILRRTKTQVAQDLPAKVEQTLFCELEDAQRTLYNELRDHYRRSLLRRIESDGIGKSKMHILEALLRLRQAAIHPGLIDPKRIQDSSAKLDMLLPQLMEVLEEGHKALIFSQFTSMLAILKQKLDAEGIRYEYLDGRTHDRAVPVERFQNDPDIKLFLISLKAGGLGLNLTAAEYVYLLDPWWNPAVEAQAIDRTHRIGQTHSVFAYRLIAKDTVEEKVLELQSTKREIAEAIISQDNSLMRNLQAEDLELLLS